MTKMPSLGEQEMDLLRFINENPGVAVREVVCHFEKEKGFARTTVTTMMERLRKKGYITRTKANGIYIYSSKHKAEVVITNKITDFIEKTLGGSVSPLLTYFSSTKLSSDEIKELKILASKLNKKRGQ